MTTILAFILVLGAVILVHELGHFLAAKAAGVRVLVFSIGMGPRIVSLRRGETEYAICWFPIGGYVRMAGEEPEELEEGAPEPVWEPGDFMHASLPRRLGIITAGPLMNLVLAVFLYSALTLFYGITVIPTTTVGVVVPGSLAAEAGIRPGDRIMLVDGKEVSDWTEAIGRIQDGIGTLHTVTVHGATSARTVSLPSLLGGDGTPVEDIDTLPAYGMEPTSTTRVVDVAEGGPAEQAGIRAGDRIVRVGGMQVASGTDVPPILQAAGDAAIWVSFERQGDTHTVSLVPIAVVEDSASGALTRMMGVFFQREVRTIRPGLLEAGRLGLRETWGYVGLTLDVVGRLVSGRISAKTLGGPIMIAQLSGTSARGGLRSFLFFVGFLSINLGILNLLPIPVLDGGHLVFLGAEAVRGRPLSMRFRLIATQVGMLVLLVLMVYVTFNDVVRLF